MKKQIIAGLSAAALAFAVFQTAPLYAMHQTGHKGEQCMLQKIEQLKTKLALTPDQEKKLKSIRAEHQAFLKQKHTQKQAIKKEARKIADAKTIDQTKLNQLANKAGQLKSDSLKHRVMARHAVMQILTPEQINLLKQAKQNMQKTVTQASGK